MSDYDDNLVSEQISQAEIDARLNNEVDRIYQEEIEKYNAEMMDYVLKKQLAIQELKEQERNLRNFVHQHLTWYEMSESLFASSEVVINSFHKYFTNSHKVYLVHEADDPAGYIRHEDGLENASELKKEEINRLYKKIREHHNAMIILAEIFTNLALGAVQDELKQFRYLGPLRKSPTDSASVPDHVEPKRWSAGLGAWDRLRADKKLTEAVNEWCRDSDRFNLGYKIDRQVSKKVDPDELNEICRSEEGSNPDEPALAERIQRFLSNLPDEIDMRLVTVNDNECALAFTSSQVGVGVSQAIPVLAALLDPTVGTLAIEQPELHLHPKLQAELADIFIHGALGLLQSDELDKDSETSGLHKKVREEPIIVETHSEHLILRILRRIRETTEGSLPDGNLPVRPEDISVHYLDTSSGVLKATRLRIDDYGEFIDRWPHGFFDERMQELL